MTAFLIWNTLLLVTFALSRRLAVRTRIALLHPVLVSTVVLISVVEIMGRPYSTFEESTHWLVWLLGPAVVSFAVPIFRLRQLILAHLGSMLLLIPTAVLFGFFTVWFALRWCGAPPVVAGALALKSITAPITLEIARDRSLSVPLAAIGTMVAGLMGACLGPATLKVFRVKDSHALGLALGATSHGVGTSRAYEVGEIEGAYASIGMISSGMCAAVLLPLLLAWMGY